MQDQSAVKLESVISSDSGITISVTVTDAAGNSMPFGHKLTDKEMALWDQDPKAVILSVYAFAYSQLALSVKRAANRVDLTASIPAPTLDDYAAFKQANPSK